MPKLQLFSESRNLIQLQADDFAT